MRLELLSVGQAHDQAVIRFHHRITVVGGMDPDERAHFIDLVLGALTGASAEVAAARWIDGSGAALVTQHAAGGLGWARDDGAPCAGPLRRLGLDPGALRGLMVLSAPDLVAVGPRPRQGESPELTEARATLAAIDAELSHAHAVRAEVDALRSEVASIDEKLRNVEANRAKRRRALAMAELERVRVEAESIRGGTAAAEADRGFIAVGADVHAWADKWREADRRARAEAQRFGNRERLDDHTLSVALATPEQVPPELDALAAVHEAAEAERVALDGRLKALAAGALSPPSHPAVIRLAHSDQEEVWATARSALDAIRRVEDQSLALGGIEAEGVAPAAAADLENAHDGVDVATREMRRRRLIGLAGGGAGLVVALAGLLIAGPLIALLGLVVMLAMATWAYAVPAEELRRRRGAEAEALKRAGVVSYMTLQIRRLAVNVDPKATEPLELAVFEYRRELAAWKKLAGDLAPAEALDLEAETRAYTTALAGSRGAADEIAQLRRQLAEEAEPAVARALAALVTACAPFGIDDPRLAVDLVRQQADMSTHARLQAALEEAERCERDARDALERKLAGFGFGPAPDGDPARNIDLEQRLGAFDEATAAAAARERARAAVRPVPEVEADLARLEAAVAAEGPPGLPDQAEMIDETDLDVEWLGARRAQAAEDYDVTCHRLPDIGRLSDRREAVERRVAVLKGSADLPELDNDRGDLADLLLDRVAAARQVGPEGESITVVLDEPFAELHGVRKRSILDAMEQLSTSVQLIYLTDDVDMLVWARREASPGAVSLLEPIPEPA